MAAGCVFHRTLTRSRSGSGFGQNKAQAPVVCREQLVTLDVERYTRDQSSALCFPQNVLQGADLYDLTLFDGDCLLRVSLDPALNHLVEKHVLRRGAVIRNATFRSSLSLQLPHSSASLQLPQSSVAAQDSDHINHTDSFSLVSLEVCGLQPDPDPGPRSWFGSGPGSGPGSTRVLPLRAKRSVFLPLWNNADPHGEDWRRAPPTEEEEEEEGVGPEREGAGSEEEGEELEEEALVPSVSVAELRSRFLSSVTRGNSQKQLIVRVINKSQLMYYGRGERNCACPYKAVLEVCDLSGSVCVVLWNSVCLDWYLRLTPGDVISLRRFRVKQQFQGERQDDIEISVNSRNPAAQIRKLPESSVSPDYLPPEPAYTFYTNAELRDRPHGTVCDVIGLVTFSGRSERIRSKDSQGAELFLEYRWLRLDDSSSSDDDNNEPITVKLFATSQPDVHRQLLPMSVVVCTRLKLVRTLDQTQFYMTNTCYSQVYCTGLGQHSKMTYRRQSAVRRFLKWLRTQDDAQVLGRALVGGFFVFPPPPVTMETYMKSRRVAPGLLQGAELQRELDRLCFRERRSFCFQATVTAVTHCRRGQEDQCLSWALHPPSPSASPSLTPLSSPRPGSSPCCGSSPFPVPSHHSATSPRLGPSSPRPCGPSSPPCGSSPLRSLRSPSSSSSSFFPAASSSPVNQLRPRPQDHAPSRSLKRRLFQAESPNKRSPWATLRPEPNNNSVILFEASMEFIENPEDSDGEDGSSSSSSSFVTAPPLPPPPTLVPVAAETLPMRFDHARREEQAVAVTMGADMADDDAAAEKFEFAFEDYYCLRLKVLSGLTLDVLFLPSSRLPPCPVVRHSNSWAAILSHGSFSPHGPPPAPADLIATAPQLANQRLLCVLEACRLGGASVELVLSRAFVLSP